MFVVTRFSGSGHDVSPVVFVVTRFSGSGHDVSPVVFVVTRFSGSGHDVSPLAVADPHTAPVTGADLRRTR